MQRREVDRDPPDEIERFGGRRGELVQLWSDTGLRDVVDGELNVSAGYRDFDELWDGFLGGVGPVGVHALSLDGERREVMRDALHRRVGSPEGPFELTARAWYAAGIV